MKQALILIVTLLGGSLLVLFTIFLTETSYQVTFEQDVPPPALAPPPPQEGQESSPPPKVPLENFLPPPAKPQPLPPRPLSRPQPPPPPRQPLSQSTLYQKGLTATVNFLCENKNGTYTVATGAIIDKHGYIISNAHIIDKNNTKPTCTIRTGSPATPIGKARLIFAPQDYFTTSDPQLQARLDMSLWKLDGTRTDWPAWEVDTDSTIEVGDQLLTQSYPAELLSSEVILKNLTLLFSNTVVTEKDNSTILSRATLSAQHGSSGGILINPYTGKLNGIIFGISGDPQISIDARLLYAITPARINALVWQETKKQLGEYLATLPQPTY